MSKIIDFQKAKNKQIEKKYIVYIIFFLILIYIIYAIYLLLRTPTDTYIVDKGILTLEETATGYIIRNEQVLSGNNYKNGLIQIASEGEKVAKGQTIFRYIGREEEETKTKIDEINLKLQEALIKEPKFFTTDIKNLEKQIDEKSLLVSKLTDIHTISEYKKDIEAITTKKAKISGELSKSGSYIKELTKQKEDLEKKLTNDSEYITAPMSGVVSYRTDGLEEVLTTEDFSTLTKEKLENLEIKTGKIISTSNETGKVIDNFNTYIAVNLKSEASKNAKLGDKATIELSSGNELEGEIVYISKENKEDLLIIFNIKTLPEELIEFRKISLNITWWSSLGLKVPNSGILEDEKGLNYVIRRKNNENQKLIIKVVKQNDKFSIVKPYENSELEQIGIETKNYKKITQYDLILTYPPK